MEKLSFGQNIVLRQLNPKETPMPQIAVINELTAIADADVQNMLPAFDQQWNSDLKAIWGVDQATFTFVPSGQQPAAGTWWMVFLDDSDQAGALAYHDLTNDGLPISKDLRENHSRRQRQSQRRRNARNVRNGGGSVAEQCLPGYAGRLLGRRSLRSGRGRSVRLHDRQRLRDGLRNAELVRASACADPNRLQRPCRLRSKS